MEVWQALLLALLVGAVVESWRYMMRRLSYDPSTWTVTFDVDNSGGEFDFMFTAFDEEE